MQAALDSTVVPWYQARTFRTRYQGLAVNQKTKRFPRALIAALSACALVIAGLAGWWVGIASGNRNSNPLPVLGQAPAYHGLTNQMGATVDSDRFYGKVQFVTFLFPYCTTYCPLIAAHLAGFENTLASAGVDDRAELVTFNVDPAGAGPEQMRTFLRQYGWNPKDPRWQYLTGKPQAIRRVVRDGFHVAYQKIGTNEGTSATGAELSPQPEVVNPLEKRVHPGYDVTHNDALVVVDGKGRIRKIYDQADVVSNQQLFDDLRQLLPPGVLAGKPDGG